MTKQYIDIETGEELIVEYPPKIQESEIIHRLGTDFVARRFEGEVDFWWAVAGSSVESLPEFPMGLPEPEFN